MTYTINTVAGPVSATSPTLVRDPAVGDVVVYAGSMATFAGRLFEVIDADESIPACDCPPDELGSCPRHMPWRAYRIRSVDESSVALICRWHSVRHC